MNVAIYVRVSTQEQKLHGISVDAQVTACRAWAEERNHRIVDVYNDAGLSARAKYTKRPSMLRLLDDVRTGKIDLVIFTKLDRWFRNVADYYEVQSILASQNVKWRAIQEDYETETASGRFKVNIMLAVAQDEADRTSERIKVAADYKRTKGEAVGRPALGYRIKDKHWVIDPETKDGVAAFFAAYLSTFSVKAAMEAAALHGIHLNATHAGRILRNPTYHGDAFGVPCPAYITSEQFADIRRNAGRRTRTNRTNRVFLFSGLLRCGYCGGAMSSASMPSEHKVIKYYRCLNHYHSLDGCSVGCHANEAKIERYLVDNLADLVKQYNIRSESPHEAVKLQNSIQRIQGKIDRLKELYIDGDLDRSTYDTRRAALQREIDELSKKLPVPASPVDLPPNWAETYSAMTPDFKKAFWKKTVQKIECFKDQTPKVYF